MAARITLIVFVSDAEFMPWEIHRPERRTKAMSNPLRRPISYLLRLWPAREDGQRVWRASLEDPHTGQRLGFATMDRLANFLCDQTTDLWDDEQPPQSGKEVHREEPDCS